MTTVENSSPNLENWIREPKNIDQTKDFIFQVVEWFAQDVDNDDVDPDSFPEELIPWWMKKETYDGPQITYDYKTYQIYIFGVTAQGESVCCKVMEYKPEFYIKIPESWNETTYDAFKDHVMRKSYKFYGKDGEDDYMFRYKDSILQFEKVQRHDLDAGFTNGALFNFIKVVFNTQFAFKKFKSYLTKSKFGWLDKASDVIGSADPKLQLYEANLEPILRFMHVSGVKATGWVKLTGCQYGAIPVNQRETTCQIECEVDFAEIEDYECNNIAPIRQASFDIECYSVDGGFPLPETPGNDCFQIATTIKDFGSEEVLRHLLVLGPCDPIEGSIVETFKTEGELLCRWTTLVKRLDPDILIGYNIFGFDLRYMWVRSEMLGVQDNFAKLGRIVNIPCNIRKKTLKSAAYGENNWHLLPMIGRLQIDLFEVIKKDEKYPSYKLDYVAEVNLGEHKHDIEPAQISEYYQSKDPALVKIIGDYCIQDTLLPQRIIDKRNILPNLIEMAKVTYVPLTYLIERGQQIKVFSQIAKFAREMNYVLPAVVKGGGNGDDDDEVTYQGATVLPPTPGCYWDGIAADDFKALYPTSEIDWNLCYTTLVKDEERYGNLPGVEYLVIKFCPSCNGLIWGHQTTCHNLDFGQKPPVVCGADAMVKTKTFKFAQTRLELDGSKTHLEGLVPKILIDLLNARDEAKKQKAIQKDPFLKKIFDGKQLALKVSCNSVYGFTGCGDMGMLPCKPIAEATTTIGRWMIDESKCYAENPDNFKFVMGCREYFPLDYPYVCKFPNGENGIMNLSKVIGFFGMNPKDDIANCAGMRIDVPPESKELYVWTTQGFDRVVSFKAVTPNAENYKGDLELCTDHPHLYRVHTENGGEFVSFEKYACDVIYGDSVTGETPLMIKNTKTGKVHIVEAREADDLLEGLKWIDYPGFKDASADTNASADASADTTLRWNKERIDIPQNQWSIWSDEGWTPIKRLIRHKVNKRIYRVKIANGSFVDVTEDHSLLDCNKNIIKPKELVIGQTQLLTSFPTHLRFCDLSVNGKQHSFVYDQQRYFQAHHKNTTEKSGSLVVDIQELSNRKGDFVYDIETEIGRFAAGVGDIIVKNTDSIFLDVSTKHLETQANRIAYSMIAGAYGSEKITDHLRSFNKFRPEGTKWGELEYEKVYGNLILFTKKRYTGTLHEFNPAKPDYIDKKGIALKRRDYCDLVKEIYYDSLKTIFDEKLGDPETRKKLILKVIGDHVDGLLDGKVDFKKLILSKLLKGSYKMREQKNTFDKKNKCYKFNDANIFVDDFVYFEDQYHEYEAKVIQKFSKVGISFFQASNCKANKGRDLKVVITDVYHPPKHGVRRKKDDRIRHKEGLKFIGTTRNLYYDDITFKKGFTIKLSKIIDQETTDKELAPVTQAHVRLARKLYKRDPGSAPKPGMRVPYVFVETDDPDELQYMKAEDPKFVELSALKPDPMYYLECQLEKPIGQLTTILFDKQVTEELFRESVNKYKRRKNKQSSIMDFFGGGKPAPLKKSRKK